MLRNRNMTREDCEAANTANIPFLRERMSKSGMDFLLSQDSMGRNVLHILMEIKNESRIMKDDYVDFIQQVLGIYPALVCQTDLNGDTPVHILVRNNPDTKIHFASGNQDHSTQQTSDENTDLKNNVTSLLSVLLELCNETYKSILKIQTDSASFRGSRIGSPWLVQNAKGNTPLHEVLGTNNTKLVSKLLTNDRRSACLVNKCKETPLHVLAGRSTNMEPINTKDIELMVEANVKATLSLDQNNNTPVLRAIQACNISTATKLCTLSPDAAKFCDANGQTIWHLLVNHPSAYYLHLLLKIKTLREQLKLKDNDGNTPLHLAIQGNRFDLLEVFLDSWKSECESESSKGKDQWLVDLIKIPNKAGKTSGDLIAESPSLPPKIEKSIGNRCEMIGVRSIWGVPTTQMKTYVNTMGVIAALITTITFTAAFTIPGGLNQDKGTPILIERATFQVFMISDVLAMCLSMMVLFCLLWIMATNSRDNSVMLLDFSVTLLLASFYATVITFMTGLFATMFPVKPWIAIVTLALCSLLLVLVHKFLVIKLLLPVRKATLCFVWMLMRSACEVFGKITKCCERTPSRGAGGQDLPPANINKV